LVYGRTNEFRLDVKSRWGMGEGGALYEVNRAFSPVIADN
jgi:hypothetical protein